MMVCDRMWCQCPQYSERIVCNVSRPVSPIGILWKQRFKDNKGVLETISTCDAPQLIASVCRTLVKGHGKNLCTGSILLVVDSFLLELLGLLVCACVCLLDLPSQVASAKCMLERPSVTWWHCVCFGILRAERNLKRVPDTTKFVC